jgi:hypothetical protein
MRGSLADDVATQQPRILHVVHVLRYVRARQLLSTSLTANLDDIAVAVNIALFVQTRFQSGERVTSKVAHICPHVLPNSFHHLQTELESVFEISIASYLKRYYAPSETVCAGNTSVLSAALSSDSERYTPKGTLRSVPSATCSPHPWNR